MTDGAKTYSETHHPIFDDKGEIKTDASGKPIFSRERNYTGIREKETAVKALLLLEIQDLVPEECTFHHCKYYKYNVKNSDGTITEVYCAGHNALLIRFAKFPDEKGFHYFK